MKIELHPIIGESDRHFVQVSEFSFEAYPVQIKHDFCCLPVNTSSRDKPRNLRRNVWSGGISQI